MGMPGQIATKLEQKPQQIRELLLKNPRKRWSDSIPVWIRVFWKKYIASAVTRNPQYHTIIPATSNHTSWNLGAQPDRSTIEGVYAAVNGDKDHASNKQNSKKVHIVSMLSAGERILTENDQIFKKENGVATKVDRMPWFDHGVLDLTTGRNQTVASMREFQKSLHKEFEANPPATIFYCHCMAGRSRSFLETMAFIYFYPDKNKLFDFINWSQAIKKEIPEDLQKRLQNNPSFRDIAEFVKIQRSKVKTFATLDGDQAGFVGLMALSKAAEDKDFKEIKNKREVNISRLYRDARDIGLMLKAPLDRSFRTDEDLAAQEENLIAVYKAYKDNGIDLLKAMIVPVGLKHIVNPDETFEENFKKLIPGEQARFAILLKKLEEKGVKLQSVFKNASEYARLALEHAKKLTAGDQVELLRVFGIMPGLSYESIRKKILTGSSLDRYNAEIQLKQLDVVWQKAKSSSNTQQWSDLPRVTDERGSSVRSFFKSLKKKSQVILGKQNLPSYEKKIGSCITANKVCSWIKHTNDNLSRTDDSLGSKKTVIAGSGLSLQNDRETEVNNSRTH